MITVKRPRRVSVGRFVDVVDWKRRRLVNAQELFEKFSHWKSFSKPALK